MTRQCHEVPVKARMIYLKVLRDKFRGQTVGDVKWNMNDVVCTYVIFEYNYPRVFSGTSRVRFSIYNSENSTKVCFADGGET